MTTSPSPTILLRSGWQTVNIGDIGHSPGVLTLLERHIPEARLIYWSNAGDRGVKQMIHRRFPQVRFVSGNLTADGADNADLADAVEQADLLIHGSAPYLAAADHVAAWIERTGRPWGALGVTMETPSEEHQRLARSASFLFTRETESLEHLERVNARPERCAFMPDGVFAIDLLDEEANQRFMDEHDLANQPFAVFVPRLRKTPYHLIRPEQEHDPQHVAEVEALNARWAEPDHAKMRTAIVRYVRETGRPAVLVPEMTYQLDIMDDLLIAPLPADVKAQVVRRRDFWLPDEAGSLYRRAEAVVSFECHSPIIAMAHGTPAIYLRQPQDTIKGQMYNDIGVGDWMFAIEPSTGEAIADRLMSIVQDPAAARQRVRNVMQHVTALQSNALTAVRAALGLATSQAR